MIQDVSRTGRPWMLMGLGALAFGLVLMIKLGGVDLGSRQVDTDGKVYSAAADAFAPMAISTTQAGLIEPPGVAKPLRLFSVRMGGNPTEGIAVLGAAEASSRTYVAGAQLENGATLAEVHGNHVVLTRNGERFMLYLPGQGGDGDPRLTSISPSALTVGDFPEPAPLLTPPALRVSDSLRIAPVYEGETINGFSLHAGFKGGQFDRWGLKAGDVLVSLSGQALYSAEQIEALLDELANGAVLRGEVLRGGDRVAVTLDGSMLTAATQPPMFPPMPLPLP